MRHWTASDMPSQRDRTAVVTGTGGLGFETALALARAGAHVIVAGRSASKGAAAVASITRQLPDARVQFEALDLASLASIDAFGTRLRASLEGLDLLVSNAGVMTPPTRRSTSDGFELQFGTNYLGHFALTAQLLPLLRMRERARVVTVSSIAARNGAIRFDDLQSEQRYDPGTAYSQSKLACLMFALELQRRSDTAGWGLQSIGAHPGISRTDLLPNGSGSRSPQGLARRYLWFLFQPAAQGALPSLYAATSPKALGGAYYGPHALSETRGYPVDAKIPPPAADIRSCSRLWVESERLTGMRFPASAAQSTPRIQ